MPTLKRRLMNLLITIVLVLIGFALFLRWREPSMIYFPDRAIAATPDTVGLRYEDVWLTTADGVRIHGWFVPASPSTIHHPPSTILLLHGNAGNISHRFEKLEILHSLGANVLIIDYRGYGRSAGKPDEQGTYRDAEAALRHLGTEAARTILYGESLGSAVAVDLATKVPVRGVIIEEAFTSVGDVGQRMFPFLPVRWLVRNKYDTLGKIGRINAPLLIFHSRQDEFFSMRHAERLLAAAREPKRLVELRGSHNDAFLVSGETYRGALADFLHSL
jgi:pimeloyl-ACP methyl ester carboxylesterase